MPILRIRVSDISTSEETQGALRMPFFQRAATPSRRLSNRRACKHHKAQKEMCQTDLLVLSTRGGSRRTNTRHVMQSCAFVVAVS